MVLNDCSQIMNGSTAFHLDLQFGANYSNSSLSPSSNRRNISTVHGSIGVVQAVATVLAVALFFRRYTTQPSPRSAFVLYPLSVVCGCLTIVPYIILTSVQNFKGHWPFGQYSCTVMLFSGYTGVMVMVYGELLIAVNRVWASCAPLHYRTSHTVRFSRYTCVVLWFVTFATTVPFIVVDHISRSQPSTICLSNAKAHPVYSSVILSSTLVPQALVPVICLFLIIRARAQRTAGLCAWWGRSRSAVLPAGSSNNTQNASSAPTARPPTTVLVTSRRSGSSRSLVVLSWVALNTTVLWGPVTIYRLLYTNNPKLVPFDGSVISWLGSWNNFCYCSIPLIFALTVFRTPTLRRLSP